MQDLKALEGKSLAELREIGKALGIPLLMMKKKDLIEKILNFTQDGGVADTETQQSPAEAPKKTRRPRIAKTESTQASVEIREQPAAQTTTTPTPAAPKEGGKRRARKEQAAPSFAGTDTSKPEIKKIALDGETCPGMHEEPQTLPTTHPTEEIITKDDFAGEIAGEGVLEVMPDGYGFLRSADYNYLNSPDDIYVSPSQIRRFNLKTGDIIKGPKRIRTQNEKFSALLYLESVNGLDPMLATKRPAFEKLTPIFPNERIHLEKNTNTVAMRMVDLISPIGKGQRGMIVSQPKSGKTTLLKQIATAVTKNNPEMHLMILLIDERPEEVTDIKESITGDNVEVIYSTFDELPERHRRVSEMVIERAKRLVEQKQDVIILLDSITRLARAYNLTVQASGRTLSGGLDPAALHMPKRFFGAARNMREGGSLTILATALVETGSKMDDVVFEEFKGTGNMELVLDRKLSEKRVFPAIDIAKSSTRREDLLLSREEQEAVDIMRKALNGLKTDEAAERILDLFAKTRNNAEFVQTVRKNRYI